MVSHTPVDTMKTPANPPKGLLYAAVEMDSESHDLAFRCSQKVHIGAKMNVKTVGLFKDGVPPRVRVQATFKQYVRPLQTRFNCRLRYDIAKQLLKASASAKQKNKLNDTTNLNLRFEAVERVNRPFTYGLSGVDTNLKPDMSARIELSKTILGVTNTQDCRLRLGLNLMDRSLYMQARENHFTLSLNSLGQWNMMYDY